MRPQPGRGADGAAPPAEARSAGVPGGEHDPVLEALDRLVDALRENIVGDQEAIKRAVHIREQRALGLSYRTIVEAEEPPLIVERVRENLERLVRHGARFRRAEAHALHDDGMTMGEIAELFSVTRQRVSALLRYGSGAPPARGPTRAERPAAGSGAPSEGAPGG